MKPGDTVCTLSGGRFYVGEITGAAEQTVSDDGRSNLRRPVEWQSTGHPYDELPEELQQQLSVQHDVVDLTTVQAAHRGLGLTDEELADEAEAIERDPSARDPRAHRPARAGTSRAHGQQLADELLVHDAGLAAGDPRTAVGRTAAGPLRSARHRQDVPGAEAGRVPRRRARAGEARAVPPLVRLRGLLRGVPALGGPGDAGGRLPADAGPAARARRPGLPRGQPAHPALPDHRRDQPRQPGQGLRRAVLPAGVPRQVGTAHLLRRRLRAAAEPVRHRHDEHRRPVDRPGGRGDAPAVRLRRAVPAHRADQRPAARAGWTAKGKAPGAAPTFWTRSTPASTTPTSVSAPRT